jgi:hypothetical protein
LKYCLKVYLAIGLHPDKRLAHNKFANEKRRIKLKFWITSPKNGKSICKKSPEQASLNIAITA